MIADATDWQSWAAAGVVAVTAGAFVWRAIRKNRARKSGCGQAEEDCGCGTKLK